MSTVRVIHGIDDLSSDLVDVATDARRGMMRIVRDNADAGRDRARAFARESAGSHGKHYPRAITSEATGPLEAEFGPDPSMPQGGMSFERGSRNQPPHNDLAKAADIVGPVLAEDVQKMIERLFW